MAFEGMSVRRFTSIYVDFCPILFTMKKHHIFKSYN